MNGRQTSKTDSTGGVVHVVYNVMRAAGVEPLEARAAAALAAMALESYLRNPTLPSVALSAKREE